VMFSGSFAVQWGVGIVIEAAERHLGVDAATGMRGAFALALVLNIATLAWFARGWKRYAAPTLNVIARA